MSRLKKNNKSQTFSYVYFTSFKKEKNHQTQIKNDCHTGPGAEQQTRQTLYKFLRNSCTLKIPKDSKCIHWWKGWEERTSRFKPQLSYLVSSFGTLETHSNTYLCTLLPKTDIVISNTYHEVGLHEVGLQRNEQGRIHSKIRLNSTK